MGFSPSVFTMLNRSQWPTFFKICLNYVFKRGKKLIQVWNLRVSEWWFNFSFRWTIPLNTIKSWLVLFSSVVAVIWFTASLSWRLWGAVSLSPASQLRLDGSKGSSAWPSHPCRTSEERLQVWVQSAALWQQPVRQREQHQTLTSARDRWELQTNYCGGAMVQK